MKLRLGDTVRVMAGKDKGVTGEVVAVLPVEQKVVVKGANIYTKHIRPVAGRAGDKVRRERPLPVSNVAILNDKQQPDRIGFSIAKDGKTKVRVFKKTGKPVPQSTDSKGKKK